MRNRISTVRLNCWRIWLETFDAVGFDRVVFGSDTDAHDQAWELGRLLSVPVADEKLKPVLASTLRAIRARRKPLNP